MENFIKDIVEQKNTDEVNKAVKKFIQVIINSTRNKEIMDKFEKLKNDDSSKKDNKPEGSMKARNGLHKYEVYVFDQIVQEKYLPSPIKGLLMK